MASPSFIDLDTAALRSGWAIGHVARLCRDQWQASGLAIKQRPDGGGKASWLVREDADAAFVRVKMPDQIGTDLRQVPESKRREASRRLDLLRRWEEACKAAFTLKFDRERATNHFVQQLFIDEGIKLSARTLYRWDSQYRAEGLAGLVDGRGKAGSPEGAEDDHFMEQVKALYLTLRRPSLRVCHRMACQLAAERGFEPLTYRTTSRRIEQIPKAVLIKYRFGEEAYTNEVQPYIERDYSGVASNQEWCGDHHQFDVIVSHRGQQVRPWITAWQDARSRMIVGYTLFAHAPNQDTILLAFAYGVRANGVPERVYIDNGKDYDSFALNGRTKRDRWLRRKLRVEYEPTDFSGLFGELGVKAVHCEPYHGQSKPIERWFGTVEGQFCRVGWATYCGNSLADKPEDLQLQLERGNPRAFHTLRYLLDASRSPQLWCSTIDLIDNFKRGEQRGRQPLEQIRRRIGVRHDLMERTRKNGGGEPLFTVDEVRKVFGRCKMRLSTGAARYLMEMANRPKCGGLGACVVLMNLTVRANSAKSDVITDDMLHAMLRYTALPEEFRDLSAARSRQTLAKVG